MVIGEDENGGFSNTNRSSWCRLHYYPGVHIVLRTTTEHTLFYCHTPAAFLAATHNNSPQEAASVGSSKGSGTLHRLLWFKNASQALLVQDHFTGSVGPEGSLLLMNFPCTSRRLLSLVAITLTLTLKSQTRGEQQSIKWTNHKSSTCQHCTAASHAPHSHARLTIVGPPQLDFCRSPQRARQPGSLTPPHAEVESPWFGGGQGLLRLTSCAR